MCICTKLFDLHTSGTDCHVVYSQEYADSKKSTSHVDSCYQAGWYSCNTLVQEVVILLAGWDIGYADCGLRGFPQSLQVIHQSGHNHLFPNHYSLVNPLLDISSVHTGCVAK
jgi:hypothetical protein